MPKKGSFLNYEDRKLIMEMIKEGYRITEIADKLGVHRSTLYYEFKRCQCNDDYSKYDADLAQQRYEQKLKSRGTQKEKIKKDAKLANYIEDKIVNDGYSPKRIVKELNETGRWKEFHTKVCTTTVYRYIDRGMIPRVSNEDLPRKGRMKEKNS